MAMVAGIATCRDFVVVEEAGELETVLLAEALDHRSDAPARDPADVGGLLFVPGVCEGDDQTAAAVVQREVVGGLAESAEDHRPWVVGDG